MLVCEDNLDRAVKVFLEEAKLPRPDGWTKLMDEATIRYAIIPAFIKALEEIEPVDFCAGFDWKKVRE